MPLDDRLLPSSSRLAKREDDLNIDWNLNNLVGHLTNSCSLYVFFSPSFLLFNNVSIRRLALFCLLFTATQLSLTSTTYPSSISHHFAQLSPPPPHAILFPLLASSATWESGAADEWRGRRASKWKYMTIIISNVSFTSWVSWVKVVLLRLLYFLCFHNSVPSSPLVQCCLALSARTTTTDT